MAKLTYLIQCGKDGPIKIGATINGIKWRIKNLQIGCPYKLTLIKTFNSRKFSERRLHHTFAHLRMEGEWFEFRDELRSFIEDQDSVEIKKLKKPKQLMLPSRWFNMNLDRSFVICSSCRKEFRYSKVHRKNKCPNCKLDNYRCRKEIIP